MERQRWEMGDKDMILNMTRICMLLLSSSHRRLSSPSGSWCYMIPCCRSMHRLLKFTHKKKSPGKPSAADIGANTGECYVTRGGENSSLANLTHTLKSLLLPLLAFFRSKKQTWDQETTTSVRCWCQAVVSWSEQICRSLVNCFFSLSSSRLFNTIL